MKVNKILAFVATAIMLFGVGCTKENTPAATTSECEISLSTDQLIVGCAGDVDMEVQVFSNGEWSVACDDGVTVSRTSGSGNGSVLVSVAESSEPLSFYEVTFTATKKVLIPDADMTYDDDVTVTLNIAQYDELPTNVKDIRSSLAALTASDVDNWTAVPAELAEKTMIAIVSSDYSGHNISNDNFMTVQDASTEPHSGLFVSPGDGVPAKYAQGDTYIVSLEGAKYKTYNKVLQLQLSQSAKRIATNNKLQPIEISHDAILDYESQYVVIKNCQPTTDVRGLSFADKYNPYFEVISGETFMVYANKNATIREYVMPHKSGSVAGIAYRYESKAELMPCNVEDLQLTESLFRIAGTKVANFDEITKGGIYEMDEVTVVGVSTKSYVLADSKGAMMLAYSGEDSSKVPAVGDKGSIYSSVETYGGVLQFSYPEFTKTGAESSVELIAEELDTTGFDALYNSITTVKYIQYVGKLKKNTAGYYEVTPVNAASKSTIHNPGEEIAATLEANIESYVIVKGFALYVDHDALNVIATSVEATTVSAIEADDILGVPAEGVENLQTNIVIENIEGEIITTCDGEVVSSASLNGTTLTYSVSINSGPAREGWIKFAAGEIETTIKVSQKGVASGSGYDKIDSVANLTAGEYYMAAYAEAYRTTHDFSANPWHLGTGVASGQIETTPYSYAEEQLTIKSGETKEAVLFTLVAVAGKTSTYYIKLGDKYLYSSEAATTNKLALTDTATEWEVSNHPKGGILLTSNGVYLGSAEASKNILRAYKGEKSLQSGAYFFKAK